jgi:holo-[acyl-carrier protein] synthase
MLVGMIVGTGTDLIEIGRIRETIARHGERFLTRVFTAGEIAFCERKKNSAESYAGRFAAKEAAAKALGTGIARGVSWLEIEVVRLPGERPTLRFHGRAAARAAAMHAGAASVSISHSRELAMATVLLESE